ncbi:MAG: hypothetical protein ACLFSI_02515 [Halorhodospira sp.]
MAEYRLSVNAYTPETISMKRLSEYIGDLARLLGYHDSVHLRRVESGSAEVVVDVDEAYSRQVEERVRALNEAECPAEVRTAWDSINSRLREDGSDGNLQAGGRNVIQFPGVEAPAPREYGPIHKVGCIEGVVIRVGGQGDPTPVHIREYDRVRNCKAPRAMARELVQLFDSFVRVYGAGKWFRSAEGYWYVKDFMISNYERLDEAPLSKVCRRLTEIEGNGWREIDDIPRVVRELRHGEE